MNYIDKLIKTINDGIAEQKEGDPFEPIPAGIITCSCDEGLKPIKRICETGKLPKEVARHEHKKAEPKIQAALWRRLVDDYTKEVTAEVIVFIGENAGVKAAAESESHDVSELDDTVDGYDPGYGFATVMTDLYGRGFDFDEDAMDDYYLGGGMREMVMRCPIKAKDNLTVVLFWTND